MPVVQYMLCVILTRPLSSIDEAVFSGTLTWKSAPTVGRTAAQFTLTLTLSLEYTSTNVTVGGLVEQPGRLKFGDGNEVKGGLMQVRVEQLAWLLFLGTRCNM